MDSSTNLASTGLPTQKKDIMDVKDVFELRSRGRLEEAYVAIRRIYANDKGPRASLAMFWTARDILLKRLAEGKTDEAKRILAALERMMPNVPDKEGRAGRALANCRDRMAVGGNNDRQRAKGPEHLHTGAWGEGLAAAYLREKGYIILERDWHSGHRDIDIIAAQDETIVFVEVKTRSSRDFADPVLAVNLQKQRNLQLAINHFLKSKHISMAYRFDVITIVGTPGCSNPEVEHIEDFRLPLPLYNGGQRRG